MAFCGASTLGLDAICLLQKTSISCPIGRVGAQVSLTVSILRTLKTGRVPPELDVPRTVTFAHVFGETFSWKAFRLQIGDRTQIPIVDQNVMTSC